MADRHREAFDRHVADIALQFEKVHHAWPELRDALRRDVDAEFARLPRMLSAEETDVFLRAFESKTPEIRLATRALWHQLKRMERIVARWNVRLHQTQQLVLHRREQLQRLERTSLASSSFLRTAKDRVRWAEGELHGWEQRISTMERMVMEWSGRLRALDLEINGEIERVVAVIRAHGPMAIA
ncbi:hypothetical protein HY480_05160 [Candidatus Uhrbacteria bacterium]|nr:hypothetical protein [Candidatus Uhrbacteria bacterium]